MSNSDLAREAFTAEAFTGRPPGQLIEDAPVDAGAVVGAPDVDWVLELVRMEARVRALTRALARFGGDEASWVPVPDIWHGNLGLVSTSTPESEDPGADPSREPTLLVMSFELRTVLWGFRDRLPSDKFDVVKGLLEVLADADEWAAGDRMPNPTSLRLMLHFLANHEELLPPRVAVTKSGTFVASWRAARDQLTSLEFAPDGIVQWLFFKPPVPGTDRKGRASGDCAAKDVMNILAAVGATEWMQCE